jgi:hypothetical protein
MEPGVTAGAGLSLLSLKRLNAWSAWVPWGVLSADSLVGIKTARPQGKQSNVDNHTIKITCSPAAPHGAHCGTLSDVEEPVQFSRRNSIAVEISLPLASLMLWNEASGSPVSWFHVDAPIHLDHWLN